MTDAFGELFDKVEKARLGNHQDTTVVLIGGCARVGKTTLANQLKSILEKHGTFCQIIAMDHWLTSYEKRKPNSKVAERYETARMIASIKSYLKGNDIQVPHYDAVTRSRISETREEPIRFRPGVLVVEGVIALALNELVQLAHLTVHINIGNCTRLKRLVKFYKNIKKLPATQYRQLITEREKEEIPFIQQASKNAGIIYNWQ